LAFCCCKMCCPFCSNILLLGGVLHICSSAFATQYGDAYQITLGSTLPNTILVARISRDTDVIYSD
jgi:hypothetical protein